MEMTSHYEVLGVSQDADRSEIEDAYRVLVQRFHPDSHVDAGPMERDLLETQMARINLARDVLSDPARRAEHDRELAMASRLESLRFPGPGDCLFCGSTPAEPVKFRQQTGMIVARRIRSLEGPMCRDCALSVGRSLQNRTLMTGWWGVISFVVNLYYVAANASALSRSAALDAPERSPQVMAPLSGPMDPGPSVFGRLGFWLVAAVVALIIYAGANDNSNSASGSGYAPSTAGSLAVTNPARWEVGSCVSGYSVVRPVSCRSPHTGMIVASATTASRCPSQSDAYVEDGYLVWCIDEDR